MTPSGGRIVVELSERSLASELVHVRVTDTGIGIAAVQLERIFEPFVQLGRTSSLRREGVGLGLAISRDLARGMSGDLTTSSAPGGGPTFTLTLPSATA